MLKSVKCLQYENCTGRFSYLLEDTIFSCAMESKGGKGISTDLSAGMIATTALEYKKRNLPIIRNLVLLHKQMYYHNTLFWAENNKILIDEMYPELNYGTGIYPEVKKKLGNLLLLS